MGAEANCKVTFQGKTMQGRALLETDELIFRGDIRLAFAYKSLASVEANDGKLTVHSPSGQAVFALGPLAEKWAQKILNPKGLLDKLGVKPGMRVAVLGVQDESFLKQLTGRTDAVRTNLTRKENALIFLGANTKADLKKLGRFRDVLDKKGAIWVVWPKGKPELKEDDVRTAALGLGLVDVKVVKFSESHSALKLMIPLARR
jgi:hypothetical protein